MSSFDFQEIPKIFYSYQTQKPFSNCLVCSCYLLEDQTYIIEKALKKHPGFTAQDVIFDYAICLSCALKMRQEFSKESLEKINAYFAEHVDMNPLPPQDAPIDLDEALSQSAIEDLIPLISSDTQDILNGFYDRFLRPDPAMLLPKQPSDQLVFI
jgi:hypothetical protein